MTDLTHRQRLVLAALSARDAVSLAPVQAQKLFFLMDRKIPEELGGPQFHFAPYDYGPFDKSVYDEFEALAQAGLVVIEHVPLAGRRRYSLTPKGQMVGKDIFDSMSWRARDYVGRTIDWLRSTPFAKLVGSIYQEFPEMRVNSVFREPGQD